MIKQTDLDALVASTEGRDDVLCAYLDTDPTDSENHRTPPAFEIWARRAMADLEASHAGDGHDPRMRLRGLAAQLNEHLASLRPQGKGLAVFAGDGLWQAIDLPVAFSNQLSYGKPNLAPLLGVLAESAPYGLVQLDRREARWIKAWLGRATPQGGMGLVLDTRQWTRHELMPAFAESGGGSTRAGTDREAYEDRVEEHMRTFFRQVAEQLAAWVQATNVPALILGGNDESVAALKHLLPPDVARRVVGALSLPNYVPDAELLARANPLAEQHAQAAAASMVDEIVGTALAGGAAAVGASDVLAALQRGQARAVMLQRSPEVMAWQCGRCGTTFGQATDACSQCGGAVEATTLGSLVPPLARRTGAELRFAWGAAASRLAEYGGVGALLRFA